MLLVLIPHAAAAGTEAVHASRPQPTLTSMSAAETALRESPRRLDTPRVRLSHVCRREFMKLIFDQICDITGGPSTYRGRNMFEAHEKLNVTNEQFNALAEDLYIAFDQQGVPYRLQNEVMALLAPMQSEVVKE